MTEEEELELKREYDEIMRLTAIIDGGSASASDYLDRGILWARARIFDHALEDYAKAEELGDTSADLYYGLGIALSEKDFPDEAIQYINKALEQEQLSDYYYSLGVIYSRLGNVQDALENYSLAIKLNPETNYPYCNRGVLKQDLKDYTGALEDYNKALEMDEDDVVVLVNRAYVHNKLGNYEASEKDFTRALELDPSADRYRYL